MNILCFDEKAKDGTFEWFGSHFDSAVKLVNNFLANKEAQSDSLRVHLLRAFEISKHLEQLLLVLFTYSNSRVLNLYLYFVIH